MAYLRAAVEDDVVGRASAGAGDTASGGEGTETGGDVGGGDTLISLEVEDEANNMGSGHGSTRDGVGGGVAADPRRKDGTIGEMLLVTSSSG